MSEVAMELMNVKKRIGKREIIKGLSFTINKGEVFGFIGPNGAGKTTTIRMMVGLMQLTDGDVRILGNSIKSNTVTEDAHIPVSQLHEADHHPNCRCFTSTIRTDKPKYFSFVNSE